MAIERFRRRKSEVSLMFVLLSLLSLIVVPVLIQRRTTAVREEFIRHVNPARAQLNEIQRQLALEAEGTLGYLFTGETEFAAAHQQARAQRAREYAQLLALAHKLGPPVHEAVVVLGAQLQPVDVLRDSLYGGVLSRSEYSSRLSVQQARFREVMSTTTKINRAIDQAAAIRSDEMGSALFIGDLLTVLLACLALVSGLAVARLGSGYRSLAQREHEARIVAEESRAELNRVIESRSRFVRGFTHDVKNPLGAADGHLQLLEEGIFGDLIGQQRESVTKARHSIRVALDLMGDLLTHARAESGELKTGHESVDVKKVVEESVDEFRMRADEKGLALTLEMEHGLPSIQSDPARIRQVVTNLLSNAIKYTAHGSVAVGVARRDRANAPGGDPWIAIEVRDTGTGMSDEEQKVIFQEFRRLGAAGKQPGSGIGLAMSWQIVRALKGDLSVESQPGRGSTFTFWLPIEGPPGPRTLAG